MLVHNDPLFTLFFGDRRTKFDLPHAQKLEASRVFTEQPFSKIITQLGLSHLVLLRQTHGTQGLVVQSREHAATVAPFTHEGDFLITNVPYVGLGVATADCIPIVFFDKVKHVVALVHAGWRGSVAEVAVKAVQEMQEQFNVQLKDVKIFMGPSAKGCCYAVGTNVLSELERYPYYEKVIYKVQDKVYVDLPLFNYYLLEEYGFKKDVWHLSYNLCTICDPSFCSYRRNGPMQWRQMSVVTLK